MIKLPFSGTGRTRRGLAALLEIGVFAAALIGGLFLYPREALRELIAWRGLNEEHAPQFS